MEIPDKIKTIINGWHPTYIKGGKIFLAWNSVLTLAFDGFSPSLLMLKNQIDKELPELIPENSGTKWPKTSFGCLNDNEILSDENVKLLRNLCAEYNENTKTLKSLDIQVDRLKIIDFQCRTLEKRLFSHELLFNGSSEYKDRFSDLEHKAMVKSIIDQFSPENHISYMKNLAPAGRTARNYHRAPHTESTLIYDFNDKQREKLFFIINDFQLNVDILMPDLFSWFDKESWHITIRTLESKEA